MPVASSSDCELVVSVGVILSKKNQLPYYVDWGADFVLLLQPLKRKILLKIITKNGEVSSNALIFLQASHNWG